MPRSLLTITVVINLVCAVEVHASQVLISNLPGDDLSRTFINAPAGGGQVGGGTGDVFSSKAAGFTMPTGIDYTLDSVELRLEFANTGSVPVLGLYDDQGGNPGSSLLSLEAPLVVPGIDTFVFTTPDTFTLEAGTTYWLVLTNDALGADSFLWLADSSGITPTGIASDAGYRFGDGFAPPTSPSSTLNSYAVYATPAAIIPEPSTLILLGSSALVGSGLVHRMRRKRVA